jgi:hypothetical protein
VFRPRSGTQFLLQHMTSVSVLWVACFFLATSCGTTALHPQCGLTKWSLSCPSSSLQSCCNSGGLCTNTDCSVEAGCQPAFGGGCQLIGALFVLFFFLIALFIPPIPLLTHKPQQNQKPKKKTRPVVCFYIRCELRSKRRTAWFEHQGVETSYG